MLYALWYWLYPDAHNCRIRWVMFHCHLLWWGYLTWDVNSSPSYGLALSVTQWTGWLILLWHWNLWEETVCHTNVVQLNISPSISFSGMYRKNIYLLQEYDQFSRKSSYVFFDLFLLFVRLIEDRSKYYKINTIYASFPNYITMASIYDDCYVRLKDTPKG